MLRHADGELTTAEIRGHMQDTMQQHAAVYREGKVLAEGCVKIDEDVQKLKDVKLTIGVSSGILISLRLSSSRTC